MNAGRTCHSEFRPLLDRPESDVQTRVGPVELVRVREVEVRSGRVA